MKSVLELKHWQVFLTIIFFSLLSDIIPESFPILHAIFSLMTMLALLLWPLSLGYEMHQLLPPKTKLSATLFILNGFFIIATLSVSAVLGEEISYSESGFKAIPVLYGIFALLHLFAFPAKVLKSLELNRKAHFSDYAGDFFLFLFWPIGVWVIQPRANKIKEKMDVQALLAASDTRQN
ncbi:hypothetical protein K3G39_08885 [Pontibacter sp. HSC-14F20]|uniref:hypothetical protein n=1 Tax=Pontibacter sp. HSC-14F20 TaxID=2864136 RepID=UPI001C73D586|nr:hypothetical protein [Pontibacter sp. HSC-14F20]MBX0333354.1 hypothetical protein [Pontibacter sp. HSC-14F20]